MNIYYKGYTHKLYTMWQIFHQWTDKPLFCSYFGLENRSSWEPISFSLHISVSFWICPIKDKNDTPPWTLIVFSAYICWFIYFPDLCFPILKNGPIFVCTDPATPQHPYIWEIYIIFGDCIKTAAAQDIIFWTNMVKIWNYIKPTAEAHSFTSPCKCFLWPTWNAGLFHLMIVSIWSSSWQGIPEASAVGYPALRSPGARYQSLSDSTGT